MNLRPLGYEPGNGAGSKRPPSPGRNHPAVWAGKRQDRNPARVSIVEGRRFVVVHLGSSRSVAWRYASCPHFGWKDVELDAAAFERWRTVDSRSYPPS